MNETTYYKMRDEMWEIGELEYACTCIIESNGYGYYDYKKEMPRLLISDAKYVLKTYYEDGHVRNEDFKEGTTEQKQECREEIKQIRKWIKKWERQTKENKQ
mgnify:FL=1